jgi:hypothetical protein
MAKLKAPTALAVLASVNSLPRPALAITMTQ